MAVCTRLTTSLGYIVLVLELLHGLLSLYGGYSVEACGSEQALAARLILPYQCRVLSSFSIVLPFNYCGDILVRLGDRGEDGRDVDCAGDSASSPETS